MTPNNRARAPTRRHRPVSSCRALLGTLALLWGLPLSAQEPTAGADSSASQVRTALRAFYFSLAHQDWEALSAGILPAKVVAHHPVPDALLASLPPAPASGPGASAPLTGEAPCASGMVTSIAQSPITIEGEWATVAIPHCLGSRTGLDRFRLIHFDRRWWIVYIDLYR